VRAIVRDDPVYRELFPSVALDPERQRLDDWKTTAGGGFKSLGVEGGVSGHGAHGLILDDPHKEGDQDSPTTLENIFTWYTTAARTRLHPGGWILFVMTRWHPLDLAGRLLAAMSDPEADQWESLVLPALAKAGDPLGRKVGEPLWPERYDVPALRALRAYSERQFEGLFQQNPRGSETQLFDVSDFQLYSSDVNREDVGAWIFDLAITDKERSDYTCWARVCCRGVQLWFEHMGRFREEWPAIKARVVALIDANPNDAFVFDKRLAEIMAVQEFKRLRPNASIHMIHMAGDKSAKAKPFSDRVKAKDVFVSLGDFGDYFVREHVLFPDGPHDDFVDVSSLACHFYGLHSRFDVLVSRLAEDVPVTDERREVVSRWHGR
jgi:phage terminase large subunit-like protein